MAILPPTTRLATIRSGGGFRYTLTRPDVLWMARMAVFEGGQAADTLWALTQRFVWFEEQHKTFYPTLGDLAQAFSQPINPAWTRDGKFCRPGGKFHGTDYCSEARLDRREKARNATLEELAQRNPEAVRTAALWAQGLVGNPVPRATNFADSKVASRYLERNPRAKLLVKRGNWYIEERAAQKWPADYVFIEAPTGVIASSEGVVNPSLATAFAQGAKNTLIDWWRMV